MSRQPPKWLRAGAQAHDRRVAAASGGLEAPAIVARDGLPRQGKLRMAVPVQLALQWRANFNGGVTFCRGQQCDDTVRGTKTHRTESRSCVRRRTEGADRARYGARALG